MRTQHCLCHEVQIFLHWLHYTASKAQSHQQNAGWYKQNVRASVSEIFEVCGDTEVATAHELNDGLQVVFLFSRDANLPVLQLALHFEPLGFDRLDNLFGFVPFQALFDLQFLPGMTDG
jgi:hypothetical protein